jgi:hypothetical protein
LWKSGTVEKGMAELVVIHPEAWPNLWKSGTVEKGMAELVVIKLKT